VKVTADVGEHKRIEHRGERDALGKELVCEGAIGVPGAAGRIR
jgi:hypothetical protein